LPAPQVIAQSPDDVVSYAVSYVDLTFDTPLDFGSASAADFVVDTPDGVLPQSSVSVSPLSLAALRISFPGQDTIGYYEIQAGPQIQDFYGMTMARAHLGSFVISPAEIAGQVPA